MNSDECSEELCEACGKLGFFPLVTCCILLLIATWATKLTNWISGCKHRWVL